MIMYVVLGREDDWEANTYIVTICSTRKKAQEIIDGIGKETFPNDTMWIEEHEIDTFGWTKVSA